MSDGPRSPLDPSELLEQRAWMVRFAAALVGREGEDLVQETWVRLLQRPLPALQHPRAWLARVLRNAAGMGGRADERRRRREERVARPEAEPSTGELAARA
jgi:DNA-directed RNA polymerase specialized sigma24 family protein